MNPAPTFEAMRQFATCQLIALGDRKLPVKLLFMDVQGEGLHMAHYSGSSRYMPAGARLFPVTTQEEWDTAHQEAVEIEASNIEEPSKRTIDKMSADEFRQFAKSRTYSWHPTSLISRAWTAIFA